MRKYGLDTVTANVEGEQARMPQPRLVPAVAGCLIAAGLIVVASSCASVGGIRQAPLLDGTERVFTQEYRTVLGAAKQAVVDAGLDIEEATQVSDGIWYIVAKKGVSGFSWGELVRVAVQKESESSTVVRVLTKRRLATNVTAKGDYASTIFSAMVLNLAERPASPE